MQKAHYSPPWADTSIIGIAGSSGSGKTSLAVAIVAALNLPWVVILSMVIFTIRFRRMSLYLTSSRTLSTKYYLLSNLERRFSTSMTLIRPKLSILMSSLTVFAHSSRGKGFLTMRKRRSMFSDRSTVNVQRSLLILLRSMPGLKKQAPFTLLTFSF